jgi:hypothetical protein
MNHTNKNRAPFGLAPVREVRVDSWFQFFELAPRLKPAPFAGEDGENYAALTPLGESSRSPITAS